VSRPFDLAAPFLLAEDQAQAVGKLVAGFNEEIDRLQPRASRGR
jgi:hypothetical protein